MAMHPGQLVFSYVMIYLPLKPFSPMVTAQRNSSIQRF